MPRVRLLLPVLLTATLSLAACGDDETDNANTVPSTPPPAATTPGGAAADLPREGECLQVEAPEPKSAAVDKPTGKLDPAKRHLVTVDTSCGTFMIELDVKDNPKTANVVASLAKDGFYDGTGFHRVVPGFVVQGGDPNGNGSGGPSWQVVEKPASDTRYTKGIVAMAKTGTDPDGTSGSQFFVVVGADAGLPPQYAVAGKVVKGMKVVDAIAAQGTEGADGPPQQPVVMTKVTYEAR